MLPRDLKPTDFASYPPLAQELAVRHLAVLRRLPPSFAPLMLREIIGYDWKFPAERKDLDRQLAFLSRSSDISVAHFAALQVSPELQRMDWVTQPALFAENWTAHLWATHQIEAFRTAAVSFVADVNAALPEPTASLHRATIVMIGQGAGRETVPLFRKLRAHGTHYTNVQAKDGYRLLLEAVRMRATAHPEPYSHWYIDGGESKAEPCPALTSVTYESIRPLRAALQNRMRAAWESGTGSEALRTLLAQIQPAEFGLHGDPLFDRFQLSLLTEASGTQVYSTTFAQWAAREVLRRAQPATLVLRFAPRQRERAMNEMLAEGSQPPPLDASGSLRDADMGAYYTWLNQQRLTGSSDAAFLVWFENHSEAFLSAPRVASGKQSADPVDLAALIQRMRLE